MLKKFLWGALSSFVGAWVALALFVGVAVVVVIGIIGGIASQGEPAGISKGSILTVELNGPVSEIAVTPDFNYMDIVNGGITRSQSLLELTTAIKEAADNKHIAAIYLKCRGISASPATLNAIRKALVDFRKSGKPVYAFGESYSTADYYVASCADRIYANPSGMISLHGIGSTSIYMKNLFDKLGVSFQVVKVGKFKSAVEPYILEHMSEPARAQLDTLFNNMWGYIAGGIADARKLKSSSSIDSLIGRDYIMYAPMDECRRAGLVDSLVYEREVDDIFAGLVGKKKDDLNFVAPVALTAQTDWGTAYGSKKQIALLYAVGEIIDQGGNGTIDYTSLVPQIVKLAEDDNVKGMVLRVNSPGGSAFGSDQIGEALDYFMSKGKKLAVSMGDYAASGGYWISSCADIIYADALTITGSIGIFGLIPNVKGLTEKLGVNLESVNTVPGSDFPTLFAPLTETQQAVMQKYVERGYDQFVSRVAKGRHLSKERVRQIGEGRVWDAISAVRIGLVDSIGGIDSAVRWVASKSGLGGSYDVAVYPKAESSIWDFIPATGLNVLEESLYGALEPGASKWVARLGAALLRQTPVQARMMPVRVTL